MTPLELLAPAKNLACGMAAVDHGADAVYIGAQRFGARAAAGNSVDDIRQLCDYAHPYGVKVYVTVNTIIYDEELEATEQLIRQLDEIGVDAILVQDMSVLRMAIPPFLFMPPPRPTTERQRRCAGSNNWVSNGWYSPVSCLSVRLPQFIRRFLTCRWRFLCMVLSVSAIADCVMRRSIVSDARQTAVPVPSSVV